MTWGSGSTGVLVSALNCIWRRLLSMVRPCPRVMVLGLCGTSWEMARHSRPWPFLAVMRRRGASEGQLKAEVVKLLYVWSPHAGASELPLIRHWTTPSVHEDAGSWGVLGETCTWRSKAGLTVRIWFVFFWKGIRILSYVYTSFLHVIWPLYFSLVKYSFAESSWNFDLSSVCLSAAPVCCCRYVFNLSETKICDHHQSVKFPVAIYYFFSIYVCWIHTAYSVMRKITP